MRILNLVIVGACSALLIGCASVGRPIDQTKLAQIKKGETTREQVEALLGKPYMVSQNDGEAGQSTVLTYIFSHATVRGESFIPIYGAFAGGANTTVQQAIVTIGPDGTVSSINSTVGADQTKVGLSAENPR